MSEEINQEEIQNEPSPVEQEALSQGWVPKEEFVGEEHKWVDAAEFLRRGELFKKIDLQSRELKDLRRSLVEMKKLHSSVQEVEYKRALDTLRKEKKQALEDGDADAVISVDEQMTLIREQQKALENEPEIQEESSGAQHPEFVAWTNKNQWYVDNEPMRAWADALGKQLARSGVPPSEVLRKVEAEVKKEFPNKFRNPNQDRKAAVESPTGRSGSSKSSYQMTSEERNIMKTFVRSGVMTEAEYIAELKKVKGE
jgi:hypothetical protein